MIFTYNYWESFCKKLYEDNLHSITAKQVMEGLGDAPYIVFKHDVETNVANALSMAEIEHRWGHSGSYYVQGCLLENEKNVAMLRKMQEMGHEISYHYDVMDSNKGNIPLAIEEFKGKCALFEKNGFSIKTICQHGNPVVERKGYTSNRDFFRNAAVRESFSEMADIMVNFKEKAVTDYLYFSDAGRKFKLIYDPVNNDIVPSDDKNISFDNLDDLWDYVCQQKDNCIVSTHPHRWVKSKTKYVIKTAIFKIIRTVAKLMMKVPVAKKLMSKYYYLAKKI